MILPGTTARLRVVRCRKLHGCRRSESSPALRKSKKGPARFFGPSQSEKIVERAAGRSAHLAWVTMSLEVHAAQGAVETSDAKTSLCICAPPFGSTGAAKQLVQQDIDVEQQPWQQELCPPCDRPAGTPVRPANLFNTKCFYFNQPGGCKRDDCRFGLQCSAHSGVSAG